MINTARPAQTYMSSYVFLECWQQDDESLHGVAYENAVLCP